MVTINAMMSSNTSGHRAFAHKGSEIFTVEVTSWQSHNLTLRSGAAADAHAQQQSQLSLAALASHCTSAAFQITPQVTAPSIQLFKHLEHFVIRVKRHSFFKKCCVFRFLSTNAEVCVTCHTHI